MRISAYPQETINKGWVGVAAGATSLGLSIILSDNLRYISVCVCVCPNFSLT